MSLRINILVMLALAACTHAAPAAAAPDAGAWTPKKVPEVLVGAGPSGCANYLQDARPVMGTWAELQLCAPGPRDLKSDADAAFGELQRIENLLTTWKPTSEISAVNREAGKAPVRGSMMWW